MSPTTAATVFIILLCLVLVFHFLVLFSVIDYKNVWGGKLKTREKMLVFESISIAINAFLLYIICQYLELCPSLFSEQILRIILWLFLGIFALNSIGNLFAVGKWERILGTSLTSISCYLCWCLV